MTGDIAFVVVVALLGLSCLFGWLMQRKTQPGPALQCAHSGFCKALPDPRCAGGNCTQHCDLYCRGRCITVWARLQLNKAGDKPDNPGA